MGYIDLYYCDESHFGLTPNVCSAWQHKENPILLPAAKGKRLSVFGLMTPECKLSSWMVEGSMNSDAVIACLDDFAAQITKKTVVVIDNAPIHRSRKFMAKIKYWSRRNLLIYFLPPYSPELNLIEILWKHIKYYWLPFDAFINFQNLKERLTQTLNLVGLKWIINFLILLKVHTLMDLQGNIPIFIYISHGKYHDSNVLDFMPLEKDAIYVMDKAYVDFTALFEIDRAEAFFVTRAKQNMRFEVVEANFNIDPSTGIRADRTIVLTGVKSAKLYPLPLRMVDYYDVEKNIELTFITNNLELSALDVAYIYKNRWQIEVFFKWIKQNLTIKRLWGHSENAVHIHIWVALSTYLIVAYIKTQLKTKLSIYEIMQILSISTFDKTPIAELLTEIQSNQNVKEQPNLFD